MRVSCRSCFYIPVKSAAQRCPAVYWCGYWSRFTGTVSVWRSCTVRVSWMTWLSWLCRIEQIKIQTFYPYFILYFSLFVSFLLPLTCISLSLPISVELSILLLVYEWLPLFSLIYHSLRTFLFFSPQTVGVIVRLEKENFQVLNMFNKVSIWLSYMKHEAVPVVVCILWYVTPCRFLGYLLVDSWDPCLYELVVINLVLNFPSLPTWGIWRQEWATELWGIEHMYWYFDILICTRYMYMVWLTGFKCETPGGKQKKRYEKCCGFGFGEQQHSSQRHSKSDRWSPFGMF